MKIYLVTIALLLLGVFVFYPQQLPETKLMQVVELVNTNEEIVRTFLVEKGSPLADDTEFLMSQPHWRLLIAISAIESQYCKRQLGNNCWGIGGDSNYRHYPSFQAAIQDANDLITYWQSKGRWLTVEDMNCHYVVPCNENWVRVVKSVLASLPE